MNKYPPLPPNSRLIEELPGFEQYKGYAVDMDGNIWSCKGYRDRYLNIWKLRKLSISTTGYYKVDLTLLSKSKLTIKLHRLIAIAFIPNPNNYPQINHIDANKVNNEISNLEWCTCKQNIYHSIEMNLRDTAKGERVKGAKLKDHQVIEVFSMKANGLLNKEIAELFYVKEWVIRDIIARDTYSHVNIQKDVFNLAQNVVKSAKRKNWMKRFSNDSLQV
jgi:hypothetical protein